MYEWKQNELGEYVYAEVKEEKHIPVPLIAGAVSLVTALVIVTVFSVFVIPRLRPKTIINQTAGTELPPQNADTASFYGMGERLSDAIVAILPESTGGGFFAQLLSSGGSGAVVSSDGYILTTATAIGQSSAPNVRLSDGTSLAAEIVGIDSKHDCAVLKIQKDGLTAIEFADSSSVKSGMSVASIGRILNEQLGTTLTVGTVSGVSGGVTLKNGQSVNLIQTTASVDESSGSILVNTDGRAVGIISTMVSSGAEGIHLAIPSNDAVAVLQSLISYGKAPQGVSLGITGQDSNYGIEVESVRSGSAAEKGGLKKGDLIMKADGTAVKTVSELNTIRNSHQKGDSMTLSVYRNGEIIEITIVMGE